VLRGRSHPAEERTLHFLLVLHCAAGDEQHINLRRDGVGHGQVADDVRREGGLAVTDEEKLEHLARRERLAHER